MSKVPQPKPAYVSTEIPGYEPYDSVSLKPAGNVIYDSQQLYEVSEATSLDKTYTFEETTIPEPQIPHPISPILKQKQEQLQALREQEDRERQRIRDEIAQREREQFAREQRDKEEREQREREQREREQRAQRDKEQREREQREREQREKELSAFMHPSPAQTALSALTTIVVNAAEPSTAQVSHQADSRLPHQQSETRLPAEVIIQKPLIVDEAVTTTISTSYNEIHEMREQLIEERDPGTGELNNEVIETDYTSTYIPDEDYSQINSSKQQEPERDEESELSEEDRLARIQFAGNYTSTLVLNAYNKYKLENSSSEYKITPTPLSDELKHLLDAEQPAESDLASAQLVAAHDYSSYSHKKFSFNKQLTREQLEVKQPTLAQIIECLAAQKKLNKAANEEEHDESAKSEQCDEQSHLYNAPYSLGLRLKNKPSPLEIGNHIIGRVEPKSVADEAGIKANSAIIRINDVGCEDKTHEFVLFYLNYLLRKNACSTIELVIAEPLPLAHALSVESTDSAVVVTKESSNKSSNENLKSILRDIFSIKQPAYNYNYTLEASSSATAAQHLNTSFDHSSNIDDSSMSMSTFTLSNPSNENSNLINIIREIKSINSNLNTNYYTFNNNNNNNVRDDAVHLENSHYLITNSFVSKPADGAVSSSLDYLPYLPAHTSVSTPSFPLNEFNHQTASSESGVENLKTIILEIKASNNKHEIVLPLLPTIANTASNTTTTPTIMPQNTQVFYEASHGLAQYEQVSANQLNQYTNMNYVYETQHLPIDIQQNFENKEYYAQSNYENVSSANSHLLTILNEAVLSNSNKVGHVQHEYVISDSEKGRYDAMNIQINTEFLNCLNKTKQTKKNSINHVN